MTSPTAVPYEQLLSMATIGMPADGATDPNGCGVEDFSLSGFFSGEDVDDAVKQRRSHVHQCNQCGHKLTNKGGGTPGPNPKYRWYCYHCKNKCQIPRDPLSDGTFPQYKANFAVDDEPRKQYQCRKCHALVKKDHVCPAKFFDNPDSYLLCGQSPANPPDPLDAASILGDPTSFGTDLLFPPLQSDSTFSPAPAAPLTSSPAPAAPSPSPTLHVPPQASTLSSFASIALGGADSTAGGGGAITSSPTTTVAAEALVAMPHLTTPGATPEPTPMPSRKPCLKERFRAHVVSKDPLPTELFATLGLDVIHVTGDGSCWIYALIAACALLESASKDTATAPTPRDRAADGLCRGLSELWCRTHLKGLSLPDLQSIDEIHRVPIYDDDGSLTQPGSYGDRLHIMGLAAFLKIDVVIWNERNFEDRCARQQVIVQSPTAADEFHMKEELMTTYEIYEHCMKKQDRVAHLLYNGSNHYSCLSSAPVTIPSFIKSGIENGVKKRKVDGAASEKKKKARPTPPEKKAGTEKTKKGGGDKGGDKSGSSAGMPSWNQLPRDMMMPRKHLKALNANTPSNDDLDLDDLICQAASKGYNLLVVGSSESGKEVDPTYVYFFKVQENVAYDAPLPEGVAQVDLYLINSK